MSQLQRERFVEAICKKISQIDVSSVAQWRDAQPVRHLAIDDLLPDDLCRAIYPGESILSEAKLSNSLKERKRVAQDLKDRQPVIHEALYAFQDQRVIDAVANLLGLENLLADASLYAGGFSIMGQGDFLNPHIDNSHDGEQKLYRVLNLLYYITPEWEESYGGNFELWTPGLENRTQIHSKYNRLLLMETHTSSWHSVSKVEHDGLRCCVSNYYFSEQPLHGQPSYRHVTTFEARPEESVGRRLATKLDGLGRNAIAKLAPGIVKHEKVSHDD
jgi:Rps23 Pro-64 3,4-dihydroxylase Tpa1-like proline 4-hydroxylase